MPASGPEGHPVPSSPSSGAGPAPRRPNPAARGPTGTTIHLILRHQDGKSLRIDADLWLSVLDLAATHGWRPRLTSDPDPSLQLTAHRKGADPWKPSAYFRPFGQRIGPTDARDLAAAARRGLAGVPADEVPLTNEPFGEDHTQGLIEAAAAKEPADAARAQGAVEILSGAPSKEAPVVLRFLGGGETRVHPDERVLV